jgi:hypothetical protein
MMDLGFLAPSLLGGLFGDFGPPFWAQGIGACVPASLTAQTAELHRVRILVRMGWRSRRIVGDIADRDVNDPFGELVRVPWSTRTLLGHALNMAWPFKRA